MAETICYQMQRRFARPCRVGVVSHFIRFQLRDQNADRNERLLIGGELLEPVIVADRLVDTMALVTHTRFPPGSRRPNLTNVGRFLCGWIFPASDARATHLAGFELLFAMVRMLGHPAEISPIRLILENAGTSDGCKDVDDPRQPTCGIDP
jgi:hypothetical protein